jgi:hypothetical protein
MKSVTRHDTVRRRAKEKTEDSRTAPAFARGCRHLAQCQAWLWASGLVLGCRLEGSFREKGWGNSQGSGPNPTPKP